VTSETKNHADAVGIIPTKLLQKLFISCVVVYQKAISPFFAPSCRFHPTCSTYMIQALSLHGTRKGLWLGIKRIAKCHPLHEGGIDNVPENVKK
jgi:putative membrane protein insertion efficiency factor